MKKLNIVEMGDSRDVSFDKFSIQHMITSGSV